MGSNRTHRGVEVRDSVAKLVVWFESTVEARCARLDAKPLYETPAPQNGGPLNDPAVLSASAAMPRGGKRRGRDQLVLVIMHVYELGDTRWVDFVVRSNGSLSDCELVADEFRDAAANL